MCGRCWKCFRKNSLKGKAVSIQGEIEVFLQKRPLKQAISTLYAIQRLPIPQQELIKQQCPDLVELLKEDFSLIERYYPKSLEIIPETYREQTLKKLDEVSKPMSENECKALLSMKLFQS